MLAHINFSHLFNSYLALIVWVHHNLATPLLMDMSVTPTLSLF